MQKAPNKRKQGIPAHMQPSGTKVHVTHSAMQASATSSKDKTCNTTDNTFETLLQILAMTNKEDREPERATNLLSANASTHGNDNPFNIIIKAIRMIAIKHKLHTATKKDLEALVVFARAAKRIEREKERNAQTKMEVSELHQILKANLQGMYNTLAHKLEELSSGHKEALDQVDLVLKATEASRGMTKELEGKVGKVAEAANKIEHCAMSYWDALITKNPLANRESTSTKVLNDIE
jgi:hypothetical protein